MAGLRLAYVVSLNGRSGSLNVKYWCVTVHSNSCTNQLTGIHLSQTESSLSGHTSIYMVKHQICTRVVGLHGSSAIASTGCWSPSMHRPVATGGGGARGAQPPPLEKFEPPLGCAVPFAVTIGIEVYPPPGILSAPPPANDTWLRR